MVPMNVFGHKQSQKQNPDVWVAIRRDTHEIVASDSTYIGLRGKAPKNQNLIYIKESEEGEERSFFN